jgi:hypothetical protein
MHEYTPKRLGSFHISPPMNSFSAKSKGIVKSAASSAPVVTKRKLPAAHSSNTVFIDPNNQRIISLI